MCPSWSQGYENAIIEQVCRTSPRNPIAFYIMGHKGKALKSTHCQSSVGAEMAAEMDVTISKVKSIAVLFSGARCSSRGPQLGSVGARWLQAVALPLGAGEHGLGGRHCSHGPDVCASCLHSVFY